jgi:1-pyrroline-5-carboxylate dehydrogenase
MTNASFRVPDAYNEPVFGYAPDSAERAAIRAALSDLGGGDHDIPLVIGGKEIRTGNTEPVVRPHAHAEQLGVFHQGDASHVEQAIAAAKAAAPGWAATPWEHRIAVFLKAAELLAGPYRQVLNAATMLGQSKNVFQAEIDSACELIDFWRFNPQYAQEIYEEQPISSPGVWNRLEQRPLEGYVFAVTPFNFTSIAGNLPTAPAMMGNTVVWKPASSAVFSAHFIMQVLHDAGLPPGVINLVLGSGGTIGRPALAHADLAGVHFTGSTGVFQGMWAAVGKNIASYRSYPRLVGETGGKDFIFAHVSADLDALVANTVRGAFEYQGQKCSAASRAYIPKSLWPRFKSALLEELAAVRMGRPEDFTNFVNAVIDRAAFDSIKAYIDHAKSSPDAEIIAGGECDASEGFFIQPTVIVARTPTYKTMCEEIFGPVLSLFVYEDKALDETLRVCDSASPYALTGAVFAQDRAAIVKIADALRNTAGNFYINDKPTGAVVGQQPFGGARASGTNDKAGSKMNLLRWVSARAIKETFVPARDWRYPFLAES